jgi:hypothetical protein
VPWRAAFLCLLVTLAGCGGDDQASVPARAQTVKLGWRQVERAGRDGVVLAVRTLRVTPDGWSVSLTVANATRSTLVIDRAGAHRAGATDFGLMLLRTTTMDEVRELTADSRKAPPIDEATSFVPPLLRTLAPGARWSGTMSGTRRLASGQVVRVVVGRFIAHPPLERTGSYFLLISTRATVLH